MSRKGGVWLIHEQIRLPPIINHADKMLNEEKMIRLFRLLGQSHTGLFRRAVAFAIVAIDASANQIFPRILATAISGQYMIDRHRFVRGAAVQTAMPVTFDNILARQHDALARHVHERHQPHDAWKGHDLPHRTNHPFGVALDNFRFAEVDQNHRFFSSNDTHRLVVLTYDQDIVIERCHISHSPFGRYPNFRRDPSGLFQLGRTRIKTYFLIYEKSVKESRFFYP